MAPPGQFTVGIFSRDGEDSYKWLINMLKEKDFMEVVKHIQPIYISNNFPEFLASVPQCQFAILYHTKNRGRLNVTDVTDSLYDQELKHLSDELGKEHTIVVIDDLEDSSDGIKDKIFADQPSIKEFSQELFLISQQEKKSHEEMMKKKHQMMDIMVSKMRGKKNVGKKARTEQEDRDRQSKKAREGQGKNPSDGQEKKPRDDDEEEDTQTLQGQNAGVQDQTGPKKSQGSKCSGCCCII